MPSKLDFSKSKSNKKLLEHILGSNTEQIEMEIEPKICDLEKLNNESPVTFESIKDILNKK